MYIKTSNIKTALFTLAFLLLLSSFTSCMFSSKSQQRLFEESKTKVYDVVVVPGIPFENGQWNWLMRGRVYWSKYLYDQGIVKNVMFSGSSVYSPYYEAKIMAMYAEAIGIPRQHIFLETKAEHSTENIYYSYQNAKELGFTKIALASDPFQTKSLRRFTRRQVSADIDLIPMVIDTMKVLEQTMIKSPDINPALAYNESFISIKERQSLWKRLMGTLGHNIRKMPASDTSSTMTKSFAY